MSNLLNLLLTSTALFVKQLDSLYHCVVAYLFTVRLVFPPSCCIKLVHAFACSTCESLESPWNTRFLYIVKLNIFCFCLRVQGCAYDAAVPSSTLNHVRSSFGTCMHRLQQHESRSIFVVHLSFRLPRMLGIMPGRVALTTAGVACSAGSPDLLLSSFSSHRLLLLGHLFQPSCHCHAHASADGDGCPCSQLMSSCHRDPHLSPRDSSSSPTCCLWSSLRTSDQQSSILLLGPAVPPELRLFVRPLLATLVNMLQLCPCLPREARLLLLWPQSDVRASCCLCERCFQNLLLYDRL